MSSGDLRAVLVAVSGGRAASLCGAGPARPLRPLVATDERTAALDHRQLEAQRGPLLAALEAPAPVVVPDLAGEVRSALCVRLGAERAVLSWYADAPDAFGPDDVAAALAVVPLLELAVRAERLQHDVAKLETALVSSRKIGVALGIVMARELLTQDQAFARLVATSQRLNRKVRDLADDVQRTGELPSAS